jgi:hypothetical protein
MYVKKNRDNKPSKKAAGGSFVRKTVAARPAALTPALRAHKNATYSCRKCRFQLFSGSDELLDHTFVVGSSSFFFPAPLEWMGELPGPEDKVNCPNCKARVGSYNWSGVSAGQGVWVAPAIQLSRSKIDQRVPASQPNAQAGLEEAMATLRVEDQDLNEAAHGTTKPDVEIEEQELDTEKQEVEEGADEAEISLKNIWQMETVDHFPNDICREYAAAFISNDFVKVGKLLGEQVTFSSPVGDCSGLETVLQALRMTRGRMAEKVNAGAPKASGPSSSKVELQFMSADGKGVKLVDDLVVECRAITQISRIRARA